METQKSIILTPGNKEELDKWLCQGWVVTKTCAMPSAVSPHGLSIQPTCLVIIEKT